MISEIIEKWIKGILIDGITGNLSGLFDNVNAKVGEIASDVGSTPQAWNSGIFNMLRSLSETVVLPLAAAILALVMCHELIQMITEKNNMHDFDTSMFFRWIFKSAFAILIVPTKDGINLAVVLPESLTSPVLTAEWENRLTEISKGNADADEFMAEIEAQVRQLVKTYSCISADKQNLFQPERVIIGKCPRCSENVYEGKKNFYCGNRSCQFVMWKNDRFFEQRKKAFTPKIAAALLKNGKAKVKGLYSEKTGKTYDATVLLADTGGKYVNYRVERKE